MDPELIAYLDERFRESSQQIQGLREETSRRFDTVDKRLEQVDERLEQVDERLEQMDEQLRLTGVRVEALQSNVQVVAEGVTGVDEKLKDFRQTVHLEFRDNRVRTELFLKNMNERVRALELRAGRPEV